ncbi:ERO1 [Candida oxycetoniae]|uniref:ERO1 n=1 Tax=Candida oxycetoniae TaxID=497107 RepID=A0AAI9SSP5_9ASCO|nr:ERO1 [Candida oxycetoniae]KAI3402459.2 ERO1 [Candida oxycetoniae]
MHIFGFIILLISCVFAISASESSSNRHILPKQQFNAFDSPEFCSQIITSTCNTTFSYIDKLNKEIRPSLADLVKTSYFRYFKVDLDKQCKFWDAQHFCATENCAVEVLEDFNWSQVTNENLKPMKLGKIKLPDSTASVQNSIETEKIATCEDLDYTHIDDGHTCVHVNLLNNPERFTGYGGNQSFDVWKAIYSENCFPNTNPMSMEPNQKKEKCREKNLFYRLVSGMHASIAVHLSNEYLDSVTGEFYPNLDVFMQRVGKFNDRLSNIYFNFALVSQALVKLKDVLPLREFIQSGYDDITPAQKEHLLANNDTESVDVYDELLLEDIIPALGSNTMFNTSTLFDSKKDPNLKNEFRARFKNISAIMDCVGCDRCRMWGKIQTIGYGTALKILFEDDYDNLKFRRIEIVALINTLDRLSKSIASINNFKKMYLQHLKDVADGIAQPGNYDSLNSQNNSNGGFHFPFIQSPAPASAPASEPAPAPASKSKSKSHSDHKSRSHEEHKTPNKQSLEDLYKIPAKDRTFTQEFRLAFSEVFEALKFVLGSYKQFPVIMGKFSIAQLNQWWNQLIGKPQVYEYKSAVDVEAEEYHRLIKS